jgi:tRNA-Thr(GGU) m(6)t(6)A37 methyltransferase TsaA
MSDETGIRPGEQRVPLPDTFDAGLYYLGRIHTPWTRREDCPKNSREARESGIVARIVVDPRFAGGLLDVASATHLLILYWMDQARRDLVVQAPRHYGTPRGTFALRSPVRPNPIAASVVELVKVEDNVVSVKGLDCIDGTPLLDIKPYFASTDAVADSRVGWHAERKE